MSGRKTSLKWELFCFILVSLKLYYWKMQHLIHFSVKFWSVQKYRWYTEVFAVVQRFLRWQAVSMVIRCWWQIQIVLPPPLFFFFFPPSSKPDQRWLIPALHTCGYNMSQPPSPPSLNVFWNLLAWDEAPVFAGTWILKVLFQVLMLA